MCCVYDKLVGDRDMAPYQWEPGAYQVGAGRCRKLGIEQVEEGERGGEGSGMGMG